MASQLGMCMAYCLRAVPQVWSFNADTGTCHCHLPWCQVHALKVSLVREHAVSREHIASVLQQNAVWKPDTYVSAGGACWCLRTTVFHLELVSSSAHTKHVGGIGGIGHHAYRFLVHWRCTTFGLGAQSYLVIFEVILHFTSSSTAKVLWDHQCTASYDTHCMRVTIQTSAITSGIGQYIA